jgi:hypothetical protein
MSSRRSRLLICTVLLIPMLLCACGRETELPRWSFGVEGAEIEVFSSFDYAKLDEVSITVEKPQDGDTSEELRGVYLKDVLDYLDVSEYSSITLTSHGGSSIEYAPEIIEDPSTILVFEVDGRTKWENGIEIVQVVCASSDMWLWNLKTLTVNP